MSFASVAVRHGGTWTNQVGAPGVRSDGQHAGEGPSGGSGRQGIGGEDLVGTRGEITAATSLTDAQVRYALAGLRDAGLVQLVGGQGTRTSSYIVVAR